MICIFFQVNVEAPVEFHNLPQALPTFYGITEKGICNALLVPGIVAAGIYLVRLVKCLEGVLVILFPHVLQTCQKPVIVVLFTLSGNCLGRLRLGNLAVYPRLLGQWLWLWLGRCLNLRLGLGRCLWDSLSRCRCRDCSSPDRRTLFFDGGFYHRLAAGAYEPAGLDLMSAFGTVASGRTLGRGGLLRWLWLWLLGLLNTLRSLLLLLHLRRFLDLGLVGFAL